MNFSDVIQSFDPIKWIEDCYTISRNGRGVLLLWDACEHTGVEVENFLRAHGVIVYARKYHTSDDPTAGCHVRTSQAKFADGLLRGHNFAMLSPQLSAPIRVSRPWGAPARAQGLTGRLIDEQRPQRRRRERKERYR